MSFFSTQPKAAMRDTVAPPIIGPLISLRNLEKVFETPAGRSYVLRRISGEIQPGEFVSIMGPSGAGKSTLLHIIGMHDSEWTGEYFFAGHAVHRLSPRSSPSCCPMRRQKKSFAARHPFWRACCGRMRSPSHRRPSL